jgi:MFS family permease
MDRIREHVRKKIYIIFIVITSKTISYFFKLSNHPFNPDGLGFACLGSALSWSSPSLVKLRRPDSPIPLDSSQISWLGSSLAIGAMSIAIPYTFVFNKFGRKWLITGIGCIHITGWIILIYSTEAWHLYLGKFIHGLAVGPSYGVIPVYLAEVVGKSIRGSSVAILIISQSMGALIQYIVGPLVSMKFQNIVSIVVPIVFVICSLGLPESPYYLLRIGRREHSRNVLLKVKDIQRCLKDSPMTPFKDALKELRKKKTQKIFIIITIAIFAQHITGIAATLPYMQSIFIQMNSVIEPQNAVIIVEVVAQVSVLSTLSIIDKFGRKPLLLLSAVIITFANIITASFFYFHLSNYLGMMGILLQNIGYGMGLGSIPVILMSEIMSYSLKGWFSGYYQLVQGTYVALTIKLFQIVNDDLGSYCPYLIFAICLTTSVSVLLYIVPETKNKTLQEIQQLLSNESSDDIEIKQ